MEIICIFLTCAFVTITISGFPRKSCLLGHSVIFMQVCTNCTFLSANHVEQYYGKCSIALLVEISLRVVFSAHNRGDIFAAISITGYGLLP